MCAEHENIQINLCVSSMTEFSKESNKLNARTVCHKHYCYRTFFL